MGNYTPKECIGCRRVLPLAPKSLCIPCRTAISEYAKLKVSSIPRELLRIGRVAPVPGLMSGYKTAEELGVAISEFLREGCSIELDADSGKVPCAREFRYRSEESCHHPRTSSCADTEEVLYFSMGEGQRTKYTRLMYVLADVIREAQHVGQEKGQNLLFQLNDGTLSVNDFNEKLQKAQTRSKF